MKIINILVSGSWWVWPTIASEELMTELGRK